MKNDNLSSKHHAPYATASSVHAVVALAFVTASLLAPISVAWGAGQAKSQKKPAAGKSQMILEDGEEAVFDETEIIESLNETNAAASRRSPQKKPRMNYPPAPPDWEGFDYDTVETNMNDILERFRKHDEYYEPRYGHYQDNRDLKSDRVRRDRIKNLVNAGSVAGEDAEGRRLLDWAAGAGSKRLSYAELIDCGVERMFSSDYRNALRFFQRAVQIDPRQPEGYYNMALAYFYRNNVPLAIINFKRAIDLKPNLAEAYNNLGVCYARAKLLERGVTQFRQASIYAPTLREPVHNLDELKDKNLDFNYNDKLFREKHKLDSSSPSRIFSLRLKLCPPLLNLSGVDDDENRIQFKDKKGAVDKGAGSYDDLVAEYKTLILDAYPDVDATLKSSVDIRNDYNKYWDALNLLKVADELYEKKLYKEAERFYTQVLKIIPGVCSVHYKRGGARLNFKNLRGAEYDFSYAAQNSDDDELVREAIKQLQLIRNKRFDAF